MGVRFQALSSVRWSGSERSRSERPFLPFHDVVSHHSGTRNFRRVNNGSGASDCAAGTSASDRLEVLVPDSMQIDEVIDVVVLSPYDEASFIGDILQT